ncbi:MAG: ribosome-binding factor A [Gemmatimonadetes bacterium]|nr:ribosome-binding factor A [Gemmatimonadota bacterium]MEC7386362.1 30S ribosome-binding factor RbfA [Gemmatimonadota bacterium]|tara:strand:- start:5446 stop:5820 length:375 start_codon:yes stop_codon:yes gene_type:complete
MMPKRLARLNEQLKREVSELVRRKVRDPRVGPVTITSIEVAGDLGSARVYVRPQNPNDELSESLAGLEAAAPFLRRELGRSLHLRRVPELRFQQDHSLDQARRIEEILSDVLSPVLDEDEENLE